MTDERAPSVRGRVDEMLARPGLYVCGDSNHPTKLVPIWVDRGQAHSMEVDSPLAADRFLPTFVIYSGPHVAPAYLATAPAEPPKDGEVAARLRVIRDWIVGGHWDVSDATYGVAAETLNDAINRLSAPVPDPIPMVLHCPQCSRQDRRASHDDVRAHTGRRTPPAIHARRQRHGEAGCRAARAAGELSAVTLQ